ncbi:hypothetical protein LTR10_024157 [Elasticomyces elasticus]|uniref:uracil phosphoribosyltransferase n=1 Tax=Exophiala sideris TaxID=1016849 RepID=A0ABR0IUV8_9EURO|nr:hypothetical protein LTR10_024157 [Elasticomyces elasticus]KAK5020824.1 hypothetical protein LTS07_011413 [Exophiala sideris]KAK5022835.1 hypothetical protein LTR13_011408 [Exophiala sideris]KAK5048140.1 hypothetical protein LTR69_011426 [Exophiala sideris]KAK5176032.1 hypothetical protein LTR44_011408 [Eurotiomycetes sp. CCFEE 6388]
MLADVAIEPPAPSETVAVVVILRSGIAMMDTFLSNFPPDANVMVHHLGIFRDKKTLQPVEYYNELSPRPAKVKHAYILVPVIATGGTADAAIQILKEWDVEIVTSISVLASRAGVGKVTSAWQEGSRLVVGAIDSDLDLQGYVQPELGDIGDR